MTNPLNSSELKQIFLAAGLDPEAETEAQMIAQIESHITQHTQEARIDELQAFSDEHFQDGLWYYRDRVEERIRTLKSKTGGK